MSVGAVKVFMGKTSEGKKKLEDKKNMTKTEKNHQNELITEFSAGDMEKRSWCKRRKYKRRY